MFHSLRLSSWPNRSESARIFRRLHRSRDHPEALISDSHQSEAVCGRLGFVTIRHYNVFMPIAHDSLLYSRVEAVLASEIADGDLKVATNCRPKTASLRDLVSAALPFGVPFRIL